jgi:hypothetical protein
MFPVFPIRMNANGFITILPSSFSWSLWVNPSSKFCSMTKLVFHSVFLVKLAHTTGLNSLFPVLFYTIYLFIIELFTRCDFLPVLLTSKTSRKIVQIYMLYKIYHLNNTMKSSIPSHPRPQQQ